MIKQRLKKYLAHIRSFAERRTVVWVLRAYAVIFPFVLFLVMEGMNPTSQAGLMAAPFSNLGLIFVSALFIAVAAWVIFSVAGSVFWSYAAVAIILAVGYAVNNIKLLVTGQVFVPTDVLVVREALMMTDGGGITIERTLILRLFIVGLLHLPLIYVKFRPKLKRRIFALPAAAVVFVFMFASRFSVNTVMPALGINPTGSMTVLYRDTGFILGFHAALADHTMCSLWDVEGHMQSLGFFDDLILVERGTPQPSEEPIRPNVIIIMSESFIDPTVIYNLEFSADPISNFRRLSEDHISGNVVVPVYGGGTANTELEFLTGSSIFFFGSAYYIPYTLTDRYFYRDITTAMPWVFRENGYRTVAVHPFTRYFFNRYRVYPRLGFDEYIGREDMIDPIYRGWYVSDESFTDQIIDQILLAEEADESLFLFGISMQAHWQFWDDVYIDFEQGVTAASPYLTNAELETLNPFLQGMYDADKQLGRLIEFVESRDTPTIVAFFGDHLPILGLHADPILARLGFISDQRVWMWDEEDKQKMFQTPYLVWSNFAPTDEDWGTISTYFLGANILRHSGVNLNRYWHYILRLSEEFGALTENHYVDIHGAFYSVHNVRMLPHIQAMEGLHRAKWFGAGAFMEHLSEIIQ
ncbi:MAG: LTA synthase family protein [Oscillospiraceae bacterium]|nr:LTA synthase family protein [Oscillospiraceae bacterium]